MFKYDVSPPKTPLAFWVGAATYGMEHYRKVVKLLKEKFPEHILSVRRLPLSKKIYGDCIYVKKGNKFLIRIRRDLDEDTAIETLLHEMAHVLSWDEWAKTGLEHGPNWGKAFSKIYTFYVEELVHPTWTEET